MNKKKVKELLGKAISSLYYAVDDNVSWAHNTNAHIKDAKRCIDRALGELQKSDWVSVNEELPEYCEYVLCRIDNCGVIYYKVGHRSKRPIFNGLGDDNEFVVDDPVNEKVTHWRRIDKLEE